MLIAFIIKSSNISAVVHLHKVLNFGIVVTVGNWCSFLYFVLVFLSICILTFLILLTLILGGTGGGNELMS